MPQFSTKTKDSFSRNGKICIDLGYILEMVSIGLINGLNVGMKEREIEAFSGFCFEHQGRKRIFVKGVSGRLRKEVANQGMRKTTSCYSASSSSPPVPQCQLLSQC